MVFDELIEQRIRSLYLSLDKTRLSFITDMGVAHTFQAIGDCCSHSWFEHIAGLEALIGHVVTKVEEREMPDASRPVGGNVVQYYGWCLHTAKGRVDIEMRNESNGYYGGWAEKVEPYLDEASKVREDF